MAQQIQASVTLQDWKGLETAASPHKASPESARLQENMTNLHEGKMELRPGLRVVNYDN